jgi:O-6-methylguanine DNA methyltransferase
MNISTFNNAVHGCRVTHTYCRPSCVRNIRVQDGNRIYFVSSEDAHTQGYRPCKICNPDKQPSRSETLRASYFKSPLGIYLIASSQYGIICVEPVEQAQQRLRVWGQYGVCMEDGHKAEYNLQAAAEMNRYFDGELRDFNVQLDMRGTPFQRAVWDRLMRIPYGETCSYGKIAQAIGRPSASRAVGHANGRNPVSIIVPCHRVIGSNGNLVGYGGGLDRKDFLLNLEYRARSLEMARYLQ